MGVECDPSLATIQHQSLLITAKLNTVLFYMMTAILLSLIILTLPYHNQLMIINAHNNPLSCSMHTIVLINNIILELIAEFFLPHTHAHSGGTAASPSPGTK